MPTTRMPPRTDPLLTRLHAEWRRITVDVTELRTVASWQLPDGPVTSLDEVLDRCGFRTDLSVASVAANQAAADQQLLRLLAIAPRDPLAGRIVLQRIVPALCAVARRHTSTRAQREAAFDDLVANAWTVICTYPVDRRPRFVASNLVRDTAFSTMVRPTRRRAAGELPMAHDELPDDQLVVSVEPADELAALLDDALATHAIVSGDRDLLDRLVAHGRCEHLAAELGVTPRTVRNRRDAVLHRLRNHVRAAA